MQAPAKVHKSSSCARWQRCLKKNRQLRRSVDAYLVPGDKGSERRAGSCIKDWKPKQKLKVKLFPLSSMEKCSLRNYSIVRTAEKSLGFWFNVHNRLSQHCTNKGKVLGWCMVYWYGGQCPHNTNNTY
jgi:hypothetical protein